MNLFQYWDRGDPPAPVDEWMRGVERDNPDFAYRRLDRDGARAFIARSHGDRVADAFSACAVPAMQADFARLCLLDVEGGLYVDADHISVAPLATMVAQADGLLLPFWLQFLGTGVLFARAPGDAYIRARLALALDNIEARRFGNVLFATGPMVFNAVRYVVDPAIREGLDFCVAQSPWPPADWQTSLARAQALCAGDGAVAAAWARATAMPVEDKARWLLAPRPDYKSGSAHWENWTGSIYR